MKRKNNVTTVILLCVCLLLTGCGKGGKTAGETAEQAEESGTTAADEEMPAWQRYAEEPVCQLFMVYDGMGRECGF